MKKLRPKFEVLIDIVLKDDDLFSECLYAVLMADSSYHEIEKSIEREGQWRFQTVTWTLQNYLTKMNRDKDKRMVSLSQKIKIGELGDTLVCDKSFVEECDNADEVNHLLGKISPKKARLVKLYYMFGHTLAELALKENLTIPRIADIIQEGLKEMRASCS